MFQSLYNLVVYLGTEVGRLFTEHWYFLVPLVVGAAAVGTLLPQPRRFPVAVRAGLLALTLITAVLGIVYATAGAPSTPTYAAAIEQILFYGFSFVAVVSGILLVTQTQPARAALSFTLVVLATCGLFLLLAAPFLFAATIIVYAGAIIVTFLFVLMLAQQTGRDDADLRSREPLLSVVTGFVLLGTLFYLIELNRRAEPERLAREQAMFQGDDHKKAGLAATQLAHLTDLAGRAAKAADAGVLKATIEAADKEKRAIYLLFKEKITALRAVPSKYDGVLDNLGKQIENDISPIWGDVFNKNADNLDRQRAILKDLETIGLQALSLPGVDAPALSSLSGPVGPAAAEVRREADGRPAMPAENPTFLGKSLFTDYLLPVELGGLLLLVAVVGAIVISQRQDEQGKESA